MNRKLHLGISALAILVIGLTYGIYPDEFLPALFDFDVHGTDLKNVFRAVMGLYLAMAAYWILGIIKSSHWKAATLSCMIFMGGLASGRILGLIIDGVPSRPFVLGLGCELLLMSWGVYNLRAIKN